MKNFLFALVSTTAAATLMLTGCGVETATTAATAAQIKAEEAERAKQQMEAAMKEIEAAQKIMQQRIEEADRNASPAAP
jgi:ferritin-like protein